MTSSRNKLISQLSLYRKHNLNYLDRKFDQYVNSRPLDDLNSLPIYLNTILPFYLNSIPQLVTTLLKPSSPTDNFKDDYKSTTSEDMDASNYDVESKLASLDKPRSSNKSSPNRQSKSNYSTTKYNFGKINYDQKCFNSTRAVRKMKENTLPTDRFSRAATLAGLIFNVASATTKDAIRRYMRGEYVDVLTNSLSNDNVIKLVVECLCKMRGTALKFGQLLSLQSDILPEKFRQALISSRHEADIMTKTQVDKILSREFGENWMDNFSEFDYQPMASASLGQAHKAKLKDGKEVAVKVQFPGILDSIDSDIENLVWICTYTKLVPDSFFIREYSRELKKEVIAECDYLNEAKFYEIFRKLNLEGFYVPKVIRELTTKKVITTEYVHGKPLEDLTGLSQETRNSVGRRILKLALSEIFVYELMNTDPNPSNYLYNEETDLIGLVDFGSCRIYHRKFVKPYLELVLATLRDDLDEILRLSVEVGFLHPQETQMVINAHLDSVRASADPFKHDVEYDFKNSKTFSTCIERSNIIFNHRKKPPAPEIYSLHRKLAGAFLICKIISAKFNSKKVFGEVMEMTNL
uniref:ABC1 family protein, putative n=1 Tax=Theileria annulata TaxID=5874 RepID=A0A3B0MHF2_THEAN